MENNFPNQQVKLFKEKVDIDSEAWPQNPANRFFRYSEGYKEAGQKLYEQCITDPPSSNILVYPLIFIYRQFVELRLKELLLMGYEISGKEKDFRNIHDLKGLWKDYKKDILSSFKPINTGLQDSAEFIINQFADEDPNSTNFRYPITTLKTGRKPSLTWDNIDLKNFKNSIEILIKYLDEQWDILFSILHQQIQDNL